MTINTTQKEKPTGDGNPTAGSAINEPDCATGPRADKAFSTMQAAFAMQGHTFHQTGGTYWAERWGLVRYLPTLHDAAQFLHQIGGTF